MALNTNAGPPPVGPSPATWLATDLTNSEHWRRQLTREECDALMNPGHDMEEAADVLRPLVDDVRTAVVTGRGLLVLRGLDADRLTGNAGNHITLAFATLLGEIGTQSARNETLRKVTDEGYGSGPTTTIRGHTTSAGLGFHTDSGDIAVLVCVRQAAGGGESLIASSAAVHDLMLREAPNLVAALYQPHHFHMSGGNAAGAPPTFLSPVFARTRLGFSCRYSPHVLRSAPDVGICLSAQQLAAFDLLETTARSEDVHLQFHLQPGDIQIVNSYTTLHARTAYEDTDARGRRLLLRAWVKAAGAERRRGEIEEALRSGWIPDELQRSTRANWSATPPVIDSPWL